jgi:hypothetical protein
MLIHIVNVAPNPMGSTIMKATIIILCLMIVTIMTAPRIIIAAIFQLRIVLHLIDKSSLLSKKV